MSWPNRIRVAGWFPVAALLALSFAAPFGGCGGTQQVDATNNAPGTPGSGSGHDGGASSSGSNSGSGGGSASGSGSGSGSSSGPSGGSSSGVNLDAGLQGSCIVDVNCAPPMSNRVEVFLSGDPAANPDAAGWKFNKGDAPGAEAPAFDDSSWKAVSVPYSWNNSDGQDGPITTPAYYTGIGWYRKHYKVPSSMMGKRVYLQFDESAYLTEVYVNGMHVGTHAGGYARFRFDITAAATVGADNVISVKVDNSQAVSPGNNWIGGTNANTSPLSGDFTLFGGLERDVRILATDNLAITPLDFGGPGVYLKATNVSASSATFAATVRLLNMGTAATMATVEVNILDAMNTTVQTFTGVQPVPAGMTADAVVTGQVSNPHLWNGLADPYLYHVNVIVKNGATVTDAIVQPFGFRFYTLDPNTGFTLNGKPYALHGVCMHQDHHSSAGQFSFKDAQYLQNIVGDFDFLKDIGTDFARFAHYQHSDFTYSMADQRGIVTWAENAFVNRVPETCTSAATCTAFIANTQQQMTELVRQNYNHPAIFFWSLGNEVLLRSGPNPLQVMQNLANVAKMEDPTRTVVFAANAGTESNPVDWTAQASFFNEYYGWYYQKVGGIGPWADALHAAHPTTAIGMSEYGAGCNPAAHSLPIVETGTDRTSTFQTEEYQSFFHEQYWAAIATRPFLTLTAVWNMFDFASDYRNEGNEPGLNTKGLVTYDRATKKDAFYFYKANWSQAPVTYVTSRRYTGFAQVSTTIKVYSNQSSLSLSLNGASLGMQTSMNHVFQWTGVTWATGANKVSVTASNCTATDPMACTDQVTWTK